MLDAIIFDLDGVLIDSEPLMRFAFSECYRRIIGVGEPPIEEYLEHMGESFPHIMQHLGLPLTLWKPYRELCQKHIEQITFFSESVRILRWAKAEGLKLAILTGKDRQRTDEILQHFHIQVYFDKVVASDQLRHPKPDPEGILTIVDAFDCQKERTIMIGDAVSDILCGQRAGVKTIAVTWGIKPERVTTLCQPDYVVQTWDALYQVLQILQQAVSNFVGKKS